ncbi:Pentatricopeptide repeat-containing protein, chloroplastic, partial [Cucurbita argyrosperma subsp. argyrosperma]
MRGEWPENLKAQHPLSMAAHSTPSILLPPAVSHSNPKNRVFLCQQRASHHNFESPAPSSSSSSTDGKLMQRSPREGRMDIAKLKAKEAGERKEEVNRKIASQKAISVILRREATKAVIERKRGPTNSKKLLPRTVLEALHERITALRWESALKVFELLREQMWYRPYAGMYIKLIVMLGKCKQPEKAYELFQEMIEEGCEVSHESYTALLSAYSRSGLLDRAFSLLNEMKNSPDCQPDVFAFNKAQTLLSDMVTRGIKPNTITYNTFIDAYGKAKMFAEMESILVEMLSDDGCKPDVWTMNSTLRGFGSSGQLETMEKCYEKFQGAGIQPNIQTFNILLDSYGKAKSYEKMSAVMEYMQKYHYSWTIVTYNIVIDAFGRAGNLKQMEHLFKLMRSERIQPSCVTLCSLVKAYGQAGKRDKIDKMKAVLGMMEQRGCKPDKTTYRIMARAYSDGGMANHAREIHDLVSTAEASKRTRPDL